MSYTYDAVGNRISMSDSTGTTQYLYDDLHRLSQLTDAWGRIFDFIYDSAGRLVSRTAQGTAVTSSFAYDTAGQPTSWIHGTTPALTMNWTSYGLNGQLLAGNASLDTQTVTTSYLYDDAGQLVQTIMNPVYGEALVDRTSTHDLANRLLSDEDALYTHDASGRMMFRDEVGSTVSTQYSYDVFGQLVEVRQEADPGGGPVDIMTAQYVYDPLGRRVMRDVNGVVTRYVYDGDRVLHLFDTTSRIAGTYVRDVGQGGILAVTDHETGSGYYYHGDRLGSVTALSDDAGSVVQVYVYDEFGNPLYQTDPHLHQPFGYGGAVLDPETGLYFRSGRYYDASLGRWITEHGTGNPARVNHYPAAGNDAVNGH